MNDDEWISQYGLTDNLIRNCEPWMIAEIKRQLKKAIKRGQKK